MIITRTARQHSTLWLSKARLKRSVAFASTFQAEERSHRVPQLAHDARYREHGIQDMISGEGYNTAWTTYQKHMVDRLNELTAGSEDISKPTKHLILKYGRQAEHAALFNHASMAHNNHFFFASLTPQPTPIPSRLQSQLSDSFSSVESFRETFLATADAMFGPGFVWLVYKQNGMGRDGYLGQGNLAILTTYLAGSPYPGAHFRQQPVDMNTTNNRTHGGQDAQRYAYDSKGSGNFYGMGAMRSAAFDSLNRTDPKLGPGGQDLTPLLCVNVWQHMYLQDWGVAGKRKYLENWWNAVDWTKVQRDLAEIYAISGRT